MADRRLRVTGRTMLVPRSSSLLFFSRLCETRFVLTRCLSIVNIGSITKCVARPVAQPCGRLVPPSIRPLAKSGALGENLILLAPGSDRNHFRICKSFAARELRPVRQFRQTLSAYMIVPLSGCT